MAVPTVIINEINILNNWIELKNYGSSTMEWPLSGLLFKKVTDTFQFEINQDTIKLEIQSGRNDNKKLKISIKKTLNELIGDFLDIFLNEFDHDYKRYNGIMGHVGKQKVSLINPIQKENMALIKVNNVLINVKEKKRIGRNCWLVKFEDIISPHKNNDFVF